MTQKAFQIKLAERIIEIHPLFPYMAEYCRDYLVDTTPDFIIETTLEDITFEREKSAREDALEGIPTRHFSDAYLETLAVYRRIAVRMTDYDTFLFHGSALAMDGEGYLFTARSGVGKSTHARLWREVFGDRVTVVNDDKPLLRITDAGAMVYGTPWDGKHRLSTNIAVPLKGICFLERDATNHIEPVTPQKAYPLLLQQTYRPDDPAALARTLHLIDRLATSTGLYALGCNMEPAAAQVSYAGMQQKCDTQNHDIRKNRQT